MQFLVKDLQQDVLCITVLDRDYFSPNGKLEIQLPKVLWIAILTPCFIC